MRLVCPSCAAIYDVDDIAIPASGRRVRCSACDAAWRVSGDGATLVQSQAGLAGVGARAAQYFAAAAAQRGETPAEAPEAEAEPAEEVVEAPAEAEAAAAFDAPAEDEPLVEAPIETPAGMDAEATVETISTPETVATEASASAPAETVETRDAAPEVQTPPAAPPEPMTTAITWETSASDETAVDSVIAETAAPAVETPTGPQSKAEAPAAAVAPQPAAPAAEKPASVRSAVDKVATATAPKPRKPILPPDDDDVPYSPAQAMLRSAAGFLLGFAIVVLIFAPYLFRAEVIALVPAAEPAIEAYNGFLRAAPDAVADAFDAVADAFNYLIGGGASDAQSASGQ